MTEANSDSVGRGKTITLGGGFTYEEEITPIGPRFIVSWLDASTMRRTNESDWFGTRAAAQEFKEQIPEALQPVILEFLPFEEKNNV